VQTGDGVDKEKVKAGPCWIFIVSSIKRKHRNHILNVIRIPEDSGLIFRVTGSGLVSVVPQG
jgi:hypothetical protein